MAAAEEWFGGDDPRSDAEAEFLDAMRGRSADWEAAGLAPVCTATLAVLVPLHLQVDLPGVPSQLANLQIGLWPDPRPDGTRVEGEWGNRYLLDGGTPRFENADPSARPRELADAAAAWLLGQLARPVEVAEWCGVTGDVVATRWTLADDGELLAATGWRTGRLMRRRRPPDRVRRVR